MSDTEIQAIERGTAEGFLALFNLQKGPDYRLVKVASSGESPDVQCVNSGGTEL